MPGADITAPGRVFAMQESQLRLWGPRPYSAGTYFLTLGLDGRTELAAALFDLGTSYEGTIGNTTLALGLKSSVRVFHDEASRASVDLTFGAMALGSLVGLGWDAWLYALRSVRLPALGTRLSVGASYARPQLYGPSAPERLSAMASIEQPLPGVRGLSLMVEWFSGGHDLSNLIAGVTWHPNSTWIFVVGWKVPTRDATFHVDEQALVFEVGFFLPRLGGGALRTRPSQAATPDEHEEE